MSRSREKNGRGKLTMRSDAQKVDGKIRQGRPKMRRKDCVTRDLGRVGGEWRTTAKDRRSWRLLLETIVRKK